MAGLFDWLYHVKYLVKPKVHWVRSPLSHHESVPNPIKTQCFLVKTYKCPIYSWWTLISFIFTKNLSNIIRPSLTFCESSIYQAPDTIPATVMLRSLMARATYRAKCCCSLCKGNGALGEGAGNPTKMVGFLASFSMVITKKTCCLIMVWCHKFKNKWCKHGFSTKKGNNGGLP